MDIPDEGDFIPEHGQFAALCAERQGRPCPVTVSSGMVAPLFEREVPDQSDDTAGLRQGNGLCVIRVEPSVVAARSASSF